MTTARRRLSYFGAFVVVILVEVCIAIWVHDAFIRPYLGDVLAVIAVYFLVRVFLPTGVKWLPLYVFLFAVFVEVSQYFHLVRILGMENNWVLSVLFGGVFDWVDILCYGIGCLIVWGVPHLSRHRRLDTARRYDAAEVLSRTEGS